MFHIIPFAVGLVTGAVVLKLFRSDKTQEGLEKAQSGLEKTQGGLRDATVSSLQAIENAAARARARLTGKREAAPEEAPGGEPSHLSEEEAATARSAAEPGAGAQGAQGGAGGRERHLWTASESLEGTAGKRGDRAP